MFDGKNWTTYTTEDGLIDNRVWGIAVDSLNNKWFATFREGVSMFDGKKWFSYTEKDGLAFRVCSSLAVDRDGSVWIATEEGVSVLKPANFKR